MKTEKISFTNSNGEQLMGRLELPIDSHPHNYVLFAHCFTCNKNLLAIKNISRALTARGFAVFRFDFTGLGESEGDFADTNFSGNVEDLVAAGDHLAAHYRAPSLLIGHSLGGAAVILAAAEMDSVKAVATIGAPADPEHVTHLLRNSIEEIETSGQATVNLSGRDFTIKKQFLQDLQQQTLSSTLKSLRKPFLVLHSPQDETVSIKNAELLYHAAHHPKSFVTLDGADHLLSKREDSSYVGEVIGGWGTRYLEIPKINTLKSDHQVVARLDREDGFTTQMNVGNHQLTADEPISFGGNDFGPSPYELVSAGLSACTAMTMQMYARRKGWPLESVEVHTSYSKTHAQDCEECESDSAKIDTFQRAIKFDGDLDEKQRSRMLQIADKCPVHRTLHSEVQVITQEII
ncbi:MAG: OsmC family protein [Eudoraea sp.]|nr:OsmC family protein [Eudoraea sp.]